MELGQLKMPMSESLTASTVNMYCAALRFWMRVVEGTSKLKVTAMASWAVGEPSR
jgi:hypothetical protein